MVHAPALTSGQETAKQVFLPNCAHFQFPTAIDTSVLDPAGSDSDRCFFEPTERWRRGPYFRESQESFMPNSVNDRPRGLDLTN